MPVVSVCIPTYKGGARVVETLESVRQQTLTDWELIVVDDASPDDTARTLQAYCDRVRDPRIVLHLEKTRFGMADNWNRAIGHARGDFIKVMGQDDLLFPDCLQAQADALRAQPGAMLASCARRILSGRGRRLFSRSFGRSGRYTREQVVARCCWSGTNMVGEPAATMFRRSATGTEPAFRSSGGYYMDLDYWLRLLQHGDLVFSNTAMVGFRIHRAAATFHLQDAMADDWVRIVESMGTAAAAYASPDARQWMRRKVHLTNIVRRIVYVAFAAL